MASISQRTLPSGTVQVRLMYRLHGQQQSVPMPDLRTAEHYRDVFKLHGSERGERILREDNGDAEEEPKKDLGPTVAEAVEKYVQRQHGLRAISDGTAVDYRREAARDITPYLGEMPVGSLDDDTIEDWLMVLYGSHPSVVRTSPRGKPMAALSNKTVANRHGLLASAIDPFVPLHLPYNPVTATKITRGTDGEMVFLEPWEYSIIRASSHEHFIDFIDTLISTGMRFSEVTALRAGNFNPRTGMIAVKEAHKLTRGVGQAVGRPKTQAGSRQMQVTGQPFAILCRLHRGLKPHELFFTNMHGDPIKNATFHQNQWQPALRRAKEKGLIQKPRVHDLRHTFASWALASGDVNIFTLAKIMGHGNSAMLDRRYGHLIPGVYTNIANAVSGKFSEAVAPHLSVVVA